MNEISTTLDIVCNKDEIEKFIGYTLAKYVETAELPGFRKGAAPPEVVLKKYMNEILSDATKELIEYKITETLSKLDIYPLGEPVAADFDFKLPEKISFTLKVEHFPKNYEVKKYRDFKIKKEEPVVDDEEIKNEMERLLLLYGNIVPKLANNFIEENDLIDIDYEVFVGGNKTQEEKNKLVEVGGLFEELRKLVIGKKIGDVVTWTKGYDTNYPNKELAGRDMKIVLKINDIKVRTPANKDDEFARKLGFNNLAELSEYIRKEILRLKKEAIMDEVYKKIEDELLLANNFELPQNYLKMEVERALNEEKNLYDEAEWQRSKDAIEESVKKRIERSLRLGFLIGRIALIENITVSDEEVLNKYNLVKDEFQGVDELKLKNTIKAGILRKKVFDRILEYSK